MYKEIDDLKYKIIINENKLRRIRDKIIGRCSYKTRKKDNCYTLLNRNNFPESDNTRLVLQVNKELIGTDDKSLKVYYEVSYLEYKYPYLKILIDRLLKNDITAYNELLETDLSKEESSIDEKLMPLYRELGIAYSNKDTKKMKEICNKIEYLEEQRELNKDNEDILKYYLEAQKCINLELEPKVKEKVRK